MPRPTSEFTQYAQLGAKIRLTQIQDEIRAVHRAFPGLKFRKGGTKATVDPSDDAADEPKKPRRKRRKLTAAEKKAIGERMRKYWAARKAR